jgi:uncharacterized membrane protein (TIGR01666 family)
MDYLKQYRSFINSYYVSDGIRTTVSILAPVLVFGYFEMLSIGLIVALGALCVSLADMPGPIHHRRNALIICSILVFAMALVAGYTQAIHWLFMVLLPLFCFVFSMIGVYGARAAAVGLTALVVLVLQTQHQLPGVEVLYNSLYLLCGSVWYMLLSAVMYRIRPYKIIQQALGEYVMATAEYLKAKAAFYDSGFSYEKNYEEIVKAQISVQEKQALVSELLFKTRDIVKESSHTGRVLMMVFLDVSDLFEIVMTSHQDYEKLHSYFDATGILEEYRQLINSLAGELDTIGIALKSGRRSDHDEKIDEELLEERKHLQQLRSETLNPDNLEGFISLRHILDSIDEIATRIRTLHQHTSYDKKLRKKKINLPDPESFITHQSIDPRLIVDNLSFRSNIFRHSLRISAAVLCAFLLAELLQFRHGYWVLLTVIVILKPGYSLTRRRNIERVSGTVAAAVICAVLLYFVRDKTAIIIALAVSMAGAYSFIRKHYFTGVVLMTLYILLMFHLLEPRDFQTILKDRIIDTAIGSAIAFFFGTLFMPVWEHQQINMYMSKVLTDAMLYYQSVSSVFTGKPFQEKATILLRRNSWVSLANLSDAFNRMLSEPKSKQKNIEYLHQFVVAVHMLNSHIATLSYYVESLRSEYISEDYTPVINASAQTLQQAKAVLDRNTGDGAMLPKPDKSQIRILDQRVNELVRKRQEELRSGKMESDTGKLLSTFKSITDQFYFIYKIGVDIEKICLKLN